jgi:hypothetical protein
MELHIFIDSMIFLIMIKHFIGFILFIVAYKKV